MKSVVYNIYNVSSDLLLKTTEKNILFFSFTLSLESNLAHQNTLLASSSSTLLD